MENFKFTIFSIFVFAVLGFGGYWAFSTIESGSFHVDEQKQKELEQTNEDLVKENTQLKKELSLLQAEEEQSKNEEIAVETPVVETPKTETPKVEAPKTTTTKAPTLKYQSLIDELQKLVNKGIQLDSKSEGTAVGSIQKFLNIYSGTSNKIDNDYGPSTVTAVKNFQKAQGLTADGNAGSGTMKKMISWLKTK